MEKKIIKKQQPTSRYTTTMEEVDMHKWFEITKLNICRRGTRTVGEGKVRKAWQHIPN